MNAMAAHDAIASNRANIMVVCTLCDPNRFTIRALIESNQRSRHHSVPAVSRRHDEIRSVAIAWTLDYYATCALGETFVD